MKASFDFDITNQLYLLSRAIRKMFKISWNKNAVQNPLHGVELPKCVNNPLSVSVDNFLGVEWKVADGHSNYLSWRKQNGDDPLDFFLFIASKIGGAAWIKMMIEYHSLPYSELSIGDLESIKNHCEIEIAIKQKEKTQNENSNS